MVNVENITMIENILFVLIHRDIWIQFFGGECCTCILPRQIQDLVRYIRFRTADVEGFRFSLYTIHDRMLCITVDFEPKASTRQK